VVDRDDRAPMIEGRNRTPCTLSVVVPAFNESENLPELHERLRGVLSALNVESEIVYVDDGSRDATWKSMCQIRDRDPTVAILSLSRNFGKEIALTAGLDHSCGDAVVVMDADLQDPPEVIPHLVEKWREGYDVVYARRTRRNGETVLKRATAGAFYRLIGRAGRVRIPADTGDFRLLSRRAVDALALFRERHRFMKGLFAWIGYRQIAVDFERQPRHAGSTKWSYWKLWNLALEGFTSFTIAPLKVATFVGMASAVGALIYASWLIVRTLLFGRDVPGYPSLMVAILFLGGVQLIAVGLLGEYLGRTYNEVKNRPLYLVQDYRPGAWVKPSPVPGSERPALVERS
jgi:glycosyltransferase involved in cell wall biosynthesis